jgi:hypothetical protein
VQIVEGDRAAQEFPRDVQRRMRPTMTQKPMKLVELRDVVGVGHVSETHVAISPTSCWSYLTPGAGFRALIPLMLQLRILRIDICLQPLGRNRGIRQCGFPERTASANIVPGELIKL